MRNASKNELTGLTKQRAEGTIKKYDENCENIL